MNVQKIITLQNWLNRLALPFVFFSFGYWELVDTARWVALVPEFLAKIMSADMLVIIHGVILIVVGLAILLRILPRYSFLVATLILLEIVISILVQSGFTPILVRDVGLLAYALVLTLVEYQKSQPQA